MRFKLTFLIITMTVFVCGTARADQIVLKDGTAYSGTFIRGDSGTIEFRILNRTETFSIEDINQINFTPTEPSPAVPDTPVVSNSVPTPSEQAETDSQVNTHTNQRTKPELTRRTDSVSSSSRRENRQPQVEPETVTLPSGTLMTIRTSQAIDTDRNRVGDIFEAILEDALNYGDHTVAPRGSVVTGRIAHAEESGALAGQSQLILELTKLTVNGVSYTLRTSDYTEVGASRGNRTAATVGGTAALGAVIGAIAGGGRGAAIGAASGAAVGTGVQVVTRGQTLQIPAETLLEFRLQSPLVINLP